MALYENEALITDQSLCQIPIHRFTVISVPDLNRKTILLSVFIVTFSTRRPQTSGSNSVRMKSILYSISCIVLSCLSHDCIK